ncbi:hypothetical protein ACQ4M4_21865 [Leptolyngbya sp. AN02str]|uniref:hypothetical protein n=1 Tax=Leptolyngbya sp. AN02str TaxID=3423363 RepID=UPI003D31A7AB
MLPDERPLSLEKAQQQEALLLAVPAMREEVDQRFWELQWGKLGWWGKLLPWKPLMGLARWGLVRWGLVPDAGRSPLVLQVDDAQPFQMLLQV